MTWFTKLHKMLRDLVVVTLWVVFVIIGAVYVKIENVAVAVVSVIFFFAAITFTIFAVKANKAEKAESEKTTKTNHPTQNSTSNVKSNCNKIPQTIPPIPFPTATREFIECIKIPDTFSDSAQELIKLKLRVDNLQARKDILSAVVETIPNTPKKAPLLQMAIDLQEEFLKVMKPMRDLMLKMKNEGNIKEGNAAIEFVNTCEKNRPTEEWIDKVVGVTFENRQEHLENSEDGDPIYITHLPSVDYPFAVGVFNERTDEMLGHLKSELARELIDDYGYGFKFQGEILEITGGGERNYGCNIKFYDTCDFETATTRSNS